MINNKLSLDSKDKIFQLDYCRNFLKNILIKNKFHTRNRHITQSKVMCLNLLEHSEFNKIENSFNIKSIQTILLKQFLIISILTYFYQLKTIFKHFDLVQVQQKSSRYDSVSLQFAILAWQNFIMKYYFTQEYRLIFLQFEK